MKSWDQNSELAEKFELVAEGYWVRGMSLEEARAKAAETIGERGDTQERSVARRQN